MTKKRNCLLFRIPLNGDSSWEGCPALWIVYGRAGHLLPFQWLENQTMLEKIPWISTYSHIKLEYEWYQQPPSINKNTVWIYHETTDKCGGKLWVCTPFCLTKKTGHLSILNLWKKKQNGQPDPLSLVFMIMCNQSFKHKSINQSICLWFLAAWCFTIIGFDMDFVLVNLPVKINHQPELDID